MDIVQQVAELSARIEALQTLYTQINGYVMQHFLLFWTIIIGMFTVIGVALYFVAKAVAEKGVKNSIDSFQRTITNMENRLVQLEKESASTRQEFDLPVEVDYEPIPKHCCLYSMDSKGLVIVQIAVQRIDKAPIKNWSQIAMLPAGFKPSAKTITWCSPFGYIEINPNGPIIYRQTGQEDVSTIMASLAFTSSYIVGS